MKQSFDKEDASGRPPGLLNERVLDLSDHVLNLHPVAVCFCDRAGLIVRRNRIAAEHCAPENRRTHAPIRQAAVDNPRKEPCFAG